MGSLQVASTGQQAAVWDLSTDPPTPLAKRRTGLTAAFTPDDLIVTSDQNGTVHLRDPATLEPLAEVAGLPYPVAYPAFSADGALMVTTDDTTGAGRLWRLEGVQESPKRCRITGHWPAPTSRPESRSTTTVKYRCPRRWAISSIPIRRSPPSRSVPPARSATTLATCAGHPHQRGDDGCTPRARLATHRSPQTRRWARPPAAPVAPPRPPAPAGHPRCLGFQQRPDRAHVQGRASGNESAAPKRRPLPRYVLDRLD
jgi:hypothetical protein